MVDPVVTLDRSFQSPSPRAHLPVWWPWALLTMAVAVIVVGGVLFSPGGS